VNLLKNSIGVEQARVLVVILKEHPTLKSLCGNTGDETQLDMSGKMKGAEDAIMVAAEIVDNGALTSLDISNIGIAPIKSFKKSEVPSWSIGDEVEHGGQKGKAVYWSGNPRDYIGFCDMSGVAAITNAIRDMRAISSVNFLDNDIGTDQAETLASILKEHPTLKSLCGNTGNETELDMSGKEMGSKGAIMLAVEILDNEAISSVNVLGNAIGVEQAQELIDIKILQTKEKLTTLCGFSGDETELNLSKKNLSAGCAVLVANEISDMGAMSSLNLADNAIGGYFDSNGFHATPEGTDFILSHTLPFLSLSMSGPAAIAGAIRDMGAMTSLNLASNELGIEGAKIIAACLPKCT
jgi:hypothetical protein